MYSCLSNLNLSGIYTVSSNDRRDAETEMSCDDAVVNTVCVCAS